MNTFESQGLQTAYDKDVDGDPVALMHGIGDRMGTVPGLAEFR